MSTVPTLLTDIHCSSCLAVLAFFGGGTKPLPPFPHHSLIPGCRSQSTSTSSYICWCSRWPPYLSDLCCSMPWCREEGCVLQLGATLLSTHPVLTWIVLFFCCCSEGAELVSSIVKKTSTCSWSRIPYVIVKKIRRVNVKMAARRR